MAQFNVDEFYKELDATQESYVRKKLAAGSFAGVKVGHVRNWLAREDAERAEAKATEAVAIAKSSAFWTKIAALATVGAAAVTTYSVWVPKG